MKIIRTGHFFLLAISRLLFGLCDIANAEDAVTTSTRTFEGLVDDDVVMRAAVVDDNANLFLAGSRSTTSSEAFSITRVDSSGNRVYQVDIPFDDPQGETMIPVEIQIYDANTLMILLSSGLSSSSLGGDNTDTSGPDTFNDNAAGTGCSLYFVDMASGAKMGDSVALEPPPSVTNMECKKALISSIDTSGNDVYIMADTWASKGYSVLKVDTLDRTIVWANHDESDVFSADGRYVQDLLEVNGSFLLVGGSDGLYQYDIDTGSRAEIVIGNLDNIWRLLQIGDRILVGGAIENDIAALDASTLETIWSIRPRYVDLRTPEEYIIAPASPAQLEEGDGDTVVWFWQRVYSSRFDYSIEIGSLSMENGTILSSERYNESDETRLAGFHVSTDGTVRLGIVNTNANILSSECFFGGALLKLLFGGYVEKINGETTSRVLTLAEDGTVSEDIGVEIPRDSVVDTTVFVSTDSIGWAVSQNGFGIRYTYGQ